MLATHAGWEVVVAPKGKRKRRHTQAYGMMDQEEAVRKHTGGKVRRLATRRARLLYHGTRLLGREVEREVHDSALALCGAHL